MQETQVQSSGREDPLEKDWLPLPEEPGRGYSPWGRKESHTTEP